MFSDLPIDCQIKSLHVNKEPAVRILQQIVKIEHAGNKNQKIIANMRGCNQRSIIAETLFINWYYIFNRSAGFSFGCWVIFVAISFAISNDSSKLSGFVTRLQITVKMHSRSAIRNHESCSCRCKWEIYKWSSDLSLISNNFKYVIPESIFYANDIVNRLLLLMTLL